MSAAPLLYNLLAATAPNSSNPAAGARQVTPEEMLAHANSGLDEDEQYDSVEDYNKNANTGNPSFKAIPDSPIYVDRNGKDVTKYATDTANYGTDRLIEQPNFWERFANPQGADEANRANQQYQSMYPLAQNESDINSRIAAGKIAAIRANGGYSTPITSPDVSPTVAAFRTGNNPTDNAFLQSNDAAAEQFLNKPYTSALASTTSLGNAATQNLKDATLGNPEAAAVSRGLGLKYDIGNTIGALQRQPTEQKVLSADTINRLHTVTGVEPIKIQLAQQQLQSELGREPKYEELRERLMDNQLQESTIQSALNRGRLGDVGIEAGNNRLRNLAERRSLLYQPTAPNKYAIGPDGRLVTNPSYVNPLAVKMGSINDINNPIKSGSSPISIGNGLNIVPSGGSQAAPSTQRQMRVAQDTNTSNIITPSTNNLTSGNQETMLEKLARKLVEGGYVTAAHK